MKTVEIVFTVQPVMGLDIKDLHNIILSTLEKHVYKNVDKDMLVFGKNIIFLNTETDIRALRNVITGVLKSKGTDGDVMVSEFKNIAFAAHTSDNGESSSYRKHSWINSNL